MTRDSAIAPPAAVRAAAAFTERFGVTSKHVARAPGRVNLIGEHIDYNGGLVLPMAIDADCAAAIGPSGATGWTVVSTDANAGGCREWAFDEADVRGWVRGERPQFSSGDWRLYAAGVIACVRQDASGMGTLVSESGTPGLRMVIASDVPLGAGLSSSAALEVAIARAIVSMDGSKWDAVQAAVSCRRAEHQFAGVPCGIMDQLVSAGGRAGHAMLIDCGDSFSVRYVPVPRGVSVMVINTHVRHALAGGEYAARAASTAVAARKLGARWLCDVTENALTRRSAVLTDEEYRLARHVVTEQGRVRAAVRAMEQGDLTTLGRAMNASHDSLRDDYRVSCRELDAAVDAARGVPGVVGARMTGGGFGGCAIAVVLAGGEAELKMKVVREFQRVVGRVPDVFTVVASDCAGLV